MRTLRTLAILLSLGAVCRPSSGADPDAPGGPPPDGPAVQTTTQPDAPANRPEPPAAPRKYLEAGALLFNRQRYDLAAKYLEAARIYRDRLTPNEQIVLDEYRDQLDRYTREQKQPKVPPTPASEDPGVVTASTAGVPPLDMSGRRPEPTPEGPSASAPGAPAGSAAAGPPAPAPAPPSQVSTQSLRGTTGDKQQARWLLHQARERLLLRQFDAAEQAVAEVRGMDIKWGYFDDTPDKVAASITKSRARAGAPGTAPPRDRGSARARLREARAALAVNDVEKADALARDVRSWGLRYGLLEDTPEKVTAAVEEARQGAAVRDSELMLRSYASPGNGSRGDAKLPTAPGGSVSGPR